MLSKKKDNFVPHSFKSKGEPPMPPDNTDVRLTKVELKVDRIEVDIKEIKAGLKEGFDKVDRRFDKMQDQLNKIPYFILGAVSIPTFVSIALHFIK